MRTCNACLHKMTCYANTATHDLIRDFRLLALDRIEAGKCECPGTVDGIVQALCNACTAFVEAE